MNLNEFATEIKAKNNFLKASFGGFAGSGKSRTATEFVIGTYKALKCTKPILIIDNEKGSRFLIPLFKEAGIETLLKDTRELADVIQAFKFLQDGKIDFLFIDSLSKVWYKYVSDYKSKNRRTFMTLQDWGKILPSWQEEFADRFVNLDGNCVFTGRGGYTYDMEEDEDTKKKQFVKSGVKMKMAGETPFEPDLNIWMDICQKMGDNDKPIVWREGLILKDRSGLIDGKTFKNPTYKDFKPVVDYLINVPKGEVSGSTSIENLAPAENKEYYEKRELKEIEIEKMANLFIEYGFGTSKEDKQLKVFILKLIFGTSSGKEIEGMKLEKLQGALKLLNNFFDGYDSLDSFENKKKYIDEYKPVDQLNF